MIAAIPIALQVAGTAGSLLSKKKSAPSYDYSALVNQINANYEESKRAAAAKAEAVTRIGGEYNANMEAANREYLAAEKERLARYANESEDVGGALEDKTAADLYRRTQKGTRAAEQKAREALAGSRTFRTSGGQREISEVSRTAAEKLAEGLNTLAGQSLTRRQQAQDTLYKLDDSILKEQIGFTKEQLGNVLKTATEAQVGEINDVLSALKDKQDAMTQIAVSAANANFARGVSDSQQPSGWDKLAAVGSLGSQALNAYQLASNLNQGNVPPATPTDSTVSRIPMTGTTNLTRAAYEYSPWGKAPF